MADTIVEEAERGHFRTIVMGRRTSNRATGQVLGSVSNRVIQTVRRCAVTIVGWGELAFALVPLASRGADDGSRHARLLELVPERYPDDPGFHLDRPGCVVLSAFLI